MNNLNLIPQEFKIAKRKRKNMLIALFCFSCVLLIIAGTIYIPMYLTLKQYAKNKKIEGEISNLSYISDEIKKLNEEKNVLVTHDSIVGSYLKGQIKWTDVMKKLSSMLPTYVSVNSLELSDDAIIMQCTSKNPEAIAVFVANIEGSGYFDILKIDDIVPLEDTSQDYRFGIKVKLIKAERVVR